MTIHEPVVAQQVFDAIRKALRLNRLIFPYATECSHNRVARARDDTGILVNVPRTGPELAHKAIAETGEVPGFRFVQMQIVKHIPHADGQPGQTAAADPAEPANQERRLASWNSIGDEKIDVFLKKSFSQRCDRLAAHNVGQSRNGVSQTPHLKTALPAGLYCFVHLP
jgi:hypothetical protein